MSTDVEQDALPANMSNLELNREKSDEVNTQPDSAARYVVGFKLALILGSVSLACFLMLLDTMVISTVCGRYLTPLDLLLTIRAHFQAIPSITDTFNSLPDIGWYASAYQFGR